MPNNKETIQPFLKWAGSKRWLVAKYSQYLPTKYNRYIEPFLGSGAVFFSLQPRHSILSDINEDLISTYESIKLEPILVEKWLNYFLSQHSDTYYYVMRQKRFRINAKRAARFLYLNRTCWNGLYRVNNQGHFNVPVGKPSSLKFLTDLQDVSNALRETQLFVGDFEGIINKAKKNDFIFVDPPYTVCHNNNGFIRYNEKLFSWEDQQRLAFVLLKAQERGCFIVCTNADHLAVKKLYNEKFKKIKISRYSSISGKVTSRGYYDELLFISK